MMDEPGFINVQRMTDIQLGNVKITRQTIERFLDGLAIDPHEFGQKMNRTASARLPVHTLVNPLLRHPVIKVSGRFVAPVVQLLIEHSGQCVYEDFKETISGKAWERFQKKWSFTFEKYVQYSVEQLTASLNVWPEQDYQGMKTCDLILQEGANLILIECKASPMDRITQTFMDQGKYERELRKIVDGIKTILRTAKHLKDGTLTIPGLDSFWCETPGRAVAG
jgi:hypothetical protein